MSDPRAAVEVEDVDVFAGEFQVLSEVSAAFPAGEATFIVGKAGSGKSTLLKTAAGLVVPDRGSVLVGGRDIDAMTRQEELAFRKRASFVFQDAALWANASVYENISLPLAVHEPRLAKAEADRRIKDAVRRVGYDEGLGFRPDALSMGEQKMIALARALVLDGDLLFMDEPTASLDEASVDRLLAIVAELKAAGKTLVVVSHDSRLIAAAADKLCVVAAGKVAGFGDAEKTAALVGGELVRRIHAARAKGGAIDGAGGGT